MTGGVVIMQSFLKKWWNIPDIWLICFSVLFGNDVADIDFGKPFGLFSLLESFAPNGDCRITYPEILPVLTAMLQNGLRNIYRNQGDPDSPVTPRSGRDSLTAEEGPGTSGNQQQHGKIINTNNSSSKLIAHNGNIAVADLKFRWPSLPTTITCSVQYRACINSTSSYSISGRLAFKVAWIS